MSSLVSSVTASSESVTVQPGDRATLVLALTYADLIDNAAPAGRYTAALAWLNRQRCNDDAAEGHVRTISEALAAHSVASDLGPKLLSALEALRMSPRSRAQKGAGGDVRPPSNPLDELALRRQGLAHPPAVDTATS